jgi:hypothetical protein
VNRREFCAGLVAGAAGSLAGCPGGGSEQRTDRETTTSGGQGTGETTTREPVSLAETGRPADICEASVTAGFNIREIVDPAFDTSWTGYDLDSQYLRDDSEDRLVDAATVVGREHDGRARAYPVSVLWHHEIVNDTHGVPLMVTFCSICSSGLVAERVVDGESTRFGVSGQLWRPPDRFIPASEKAGTIFGADRWDGSEPTSVRDGANLVMYDERTRSFWSQGVARAICGPAAGTELTVVPAEVTSWGEWRGDHPDGEILLPPPHSSVDLDG